MKAYKILLFDLDDTLIDNIENVRYAFQRTVERKNELYTEESFQRWYELDRQFWRDRQDGKIIVLKEYLYPKEKMSTWVRSQRYLIYYNYTISLDEAIEMNIAYLNDLKEIVIPVEGAYKILSSLSKKYIIVIATNGPSAAAQTKIDKIKVTPFVDYVVAADQLGYMKPSPLFFGGIQKILNNQCIEDCLIIGDSLVSDIEGANNIGRDSCWFNRVPLNYENEPHCTYTITSLQELDQIL